MSARRPWAWPLVPIYAAVLTAKNKLRATGILHTSKLRWPVVSVGSLSAGGAGKTPVVIALAAMLKERGWAVDVLSRGYGRSSSGTQLVQPGQILAAETFGDEPVLIAQRTGAPVWVSSSRHDAGLAAEAAEHSKWDQHDSRQSESSTTSGNRQDRHLHLLDDGFQHRQLARTVDIALVTADDLDDALLPAGNLREPLRALRRADIVVLREDEMETAEPRVKPLLKPDAMIWTLRRKLRFPGEGTSADALGLSIFGAGLRPVAFCAIARPDGFEAMLRAAGCGIVDTIFFPDHHRFDMRDIDRIVELARSLNASGLVTTEKDAVKLTPAMREKLEGVGPLLVAALDAEFVFPERVARELERRLGVAPAEEPA